MVRLAGSHDDWEQHVHTSGRVFLSNPNTNETRWLWQKWDMKGRLFVRNIADPSQQHWLDQMDLAMRLQSGMATPEQVARYVAFTPPPPPPPPPPEPQHPMHRPPIPSPYAAEPQVNPSPSYRFRSQLPEGRDPQLDQSLPSFRSSDEPHARHQQSAFNPYQQHPHRSFPNHDNTLSGRRPPTSRFSDRVPDSHNLHQFNAFREHQRHPHQPEPSFHSAPYAPETPNGSRAADQYPAHKPSSLRSHRLTAAPSQPSLPANIPYASQSPLYRRTAQGPDSRDAFEKNSAGNQPAHTHHQPKSKKRSQESAAYGAGRYWSNDSKQSKKRSRTSAKDTAAEIPSKQSSRFAPLPETERPRSPRPRPILPVAATLSGDTYGSFQPNAAGAQHILRASLAHDAPTVGLLHDRDFRSAISEKPLSPNSIHMAANGDDDDYSFEVVVGTCQDIEKDYLRLTSAPKPEAVRPPHVLIDSVAYIKSRWRDDSAEYDWVCRQLKSVRQDYKVQHVADEHVVDVYQTHARIALENKDLGEFNTCVAQVQELYRTLVCPQWVQDEFACYRIIYNILVRASQWEQGRILRRFSSHERKRPATRFALQIRHAVVTNNYQQYFKLCEDPPPRTMVSYLLIHLHGRIRFQAVGAMVAAYGAGPPGQVSLRTVLNHLGWREQNQPDHLLEKVQVEDVVAPEEGEVIDKIRALNSHPQPAWLFGALAFFFGINVSFSCSDSASDLLLSASIDFKTTKASGLRERKGATKLITHAGSEDVKLMK